MEPLVFDPGFPGWQRAARAALFRGLRPEDAVWQPVGDEQASLELFSLAQESAPPTLDPQPESFRVPREFIATARLVACHREPSRWSLLYRLLWRLTHGEPHLLAVATDPDVIEFESKSKDIRRDVHKMRAFVRFREMPVETLPEIKDGRPAAWFVAWFEPHHHIVELNARFFVERFASMQWSILTPDRCVHWNGGELTFTPGVTRGQAPKEDLTEDLWRTYYRSIFNPARVKIGAMKKEMAPYYWRNLPEAKLIPGLIAAASDRTARMVADSRAKTPPPEIFAPAPPPVAASLSSLREAAKSCRACPLWRTATCTVFGEGPEAARVLVVGEQPGDQEDRAGRPFVGPAGKLFDRALAAARVDRSRLYVTNAVKHFKWEPQGRRRLHQKPNSREIQACHPWLAQEIALVKPDLIVCLGATAASSVLGTNVKVTEARGRKLPSPFGIPALITVHPSSLLRQPDPARGEGDFAAFVADLEKMTP